jgi:branched-chain amino acid transport system substrate-binding protein
MASAALRPQAARSWLAFAFLALLSLLMVGCAPRREAPRPLPTQPVIEPTEPVQSPRLPPDETRNRVAVLVPLSGPNAALGQSILNAANLALLDMGGERFRITAYDTAAGAVPAANEAIAEGSGLILGPLLADDVRAVAAVARRADVPVIAFSNDESVAGDGVYLMGITPRQSVSRVVDYARGRGMSRFGALVPANVYGERAGQAMTRAVEGAGGQLVGIQSFERTQIAAAATNLNRRGGYDAVLVADGSRIALQAVPVIRQTSPQPRLMATELWATETNIGASVGLRGAWYAAPSDALFGQFSTRYRARYNARPFRLATLGYDAVLLAVRVAANWPVGRAFPERALRDPGGFSGVDGAFRFGRDGLADRALEVREVGAAGNNVVSPASRGFN